jgi:hypothetical protein
MRATRNIVLLLLAAGTTSTSAAQSSSPTKGWPTATPQAVGLNAKVLDSLDAEIASAGDRRGRGA